MSWRIVSPALVSVLSLICAQAEATCLQEATAHLQVPSRVLAEARHQGRVDLYLELPAWFVRPEMHDRSRDSDSPRLDEQWLEAFSLHALETRRGVQPAVTGVMPWALDPLDPDAGWVPLVLLLPPVDPPPKRAHEALTGGPPVVRGTHSTATGAGALAGRVVYVSAGHGWAWNTTLKRWAAQRGNTHGLVEDFLTAESVNHYLVSYLERAGATVFTVREHDLQAAHAVVDADLGGAGGAFPAGTYQETGTWEDSEAAGFVVGNTPYQGSVNPMKAGGNRITPTVQGTPTATATWIPHIPHDAPYTVYVSYSQHGSRATDAHYVVTHRGGETHLRVNQQRHGQTWVRLGTFSFEAGQDAGRGAVSLLNDTDGEPGTWVSADAVRFGGGSGDIVRGTGSGVADSPTSGRPRWEECSRYYTQFAGAPPEVWDYAGADSKDDVSARSRYAAWQNEEGEDAVYISWHTNAPDPGRGTSTYVYGPNPPNGSYQFSGTEGSDQLATWVHDEIVADIQTAFDPSWNDRGIRSAYFGEVNPAHNPEMPAILVEVAFHDTGADADFLKEPRFRAVVSRAFTHGLIRYFAARDSLEVVLPPETPRALRAWSSGPGVVSVAWEPPSTNPADQGADLPSGYRLYRSADGVGFDEGSPVGDDLQVDLFDVTPGVPLFLQVTAFNDGGESMPSPVIPVIPPCDDETTSSLMVHGFYRLDGVSQPTEDLSPWGLSVVEQHRQRQVNSFDYLVRHARAFAAARIAVDSAEATAVEEDLISLEPYSLVDWALGEESTIEETLSKDEQLVLRSWMMAGSERTLLISGAELMWDLGHKGDDADRTFAEDWMGVSYHSDDADTYELSLDLSLIHPDAETGLQATMDDGSYGTFDVDFPDVLEPTGGSVPWITYEPGGEVAATRFHGAGGHWAYVMGFPLESIVEEDVRATLVKTVATALALPTVGSHCAAGGENGDGDAHPEAEPDEMDIWPDAAPPDSDRPRSRVNPTAVSTQVVQDSGCAATSGPAWWLVAMMLLGISTARRRRSGLRTRSDR